MLFGKPTVNIRFVLFLLLIVFNVLFPKGGVKLSGIPLTIGNVVLMLALMYTIVYRGFKNITKSENFIFIFIGYWIIRFILVFVINDKFSFSALVGYFVPLCVYPLVYFFIVRYVDRWDVLNNIIRLIHISIWCVLFYSIIQFIFEIGFTAIPFLTVNYSDWVEAPNSWWLEKHNGVGSVSKIVSTYQNGNLLGANLLLFCPFVCYTIHSNNLRNVFLFLSLFVVFLAGSRSMYVAIIIYIIYKIFNHNVLKNKIKRISPFSIVVIVIGSITFIWYFVNKVDVNLFRRMLTITDVDVLKSGTGRVESFVEYLQWLSNNDSIIDVIFGSIGFSYSGGAYEMLYASLFVIGGLIGLIVTVYAFVSVFKSQHYEDKMLNGIKDGFILYAIAAISEGAFWLPPLALNLWMMLGLHNRIAYFHKIQNPNSNFRLPCTSLSTAAS